MTIRAFRHSDLDAVANLYQALWPDTPRDEHRRELEAILKSSVSGPYPCALLVADPGTPAVVGFVLVGMRSHADGCDTTKPVGFVEGWYVDEHYRKQGVGRALISAAEDWARAQGCIEMASDTWIENVDSQLAHHALGYQIVDRCVNYRKRL